MKEYQNRLTINFNCLTLDEKNSSKLKYKLLSCVKSNQHILLNMNNVDTIDSNGCELLLSLLKKVKENGGKLELFGLQKGVEAVFYMARLNHVFMINKDILNLNTH